MAYYAMTYATVDDVQARLGRTLSESEILQCEMLLEDAAVMVDALNSDAPLKAKQIVSCRMIIRTLGSPGMEIPIGATQGSMSALGYSQSWTIGSSGSAGEMYMSKADRILLKAGNKIGSRSPLEPIEEKVRP